VLIKRAIRAALKHPWRTAAAVISVAVLVAVVVLVWPTAFHGVTIAMTLSTVSDPESATDQPARLSAEAEEAMDALLLHPTLRWKVRGGFLRPKRFVRETYGGSTKAAREGLGELVRQGLLIRPWWGLGSYQVTPKGRQFWMEESFLRLVDTNPSAKQRLLRALGPPQLFERILRQAVERRFPENVEGQAAELLKLENRQLAKRRSVFSFTTPSRRTLHWLSRTATTVEGWP
jgi:hypothetical protein